jgi:hypothetical protein
VEEGDAVGLTFVHRGNNVQTVAPRRDGADRRNHLQYELDEGPCLDATSGQHVLRSRDLEHDARWPSWGPRVVEKTSAQSILSFQLFINADHLGALNHIDLNTHR